MDKYYCFHGLMSVFVIWTLMPPFFRKKCILKSAGFVALYIILLTIILFWSILFFGFAFWKWMITWSSMRLEFQLSLWPAHLTYVFLFSSYRSFLCGGSTGLFIYAYCLYYYYARSDMSGFMQTSFFFGYMACICYGFFLMLGTVGFRAALFFVRHIYRSIKCE